MSVSPESRALLREGFKNKPLFVAGRAERLHITYVILSSFSVTFQPSKEQNVSYRKKERIYYERNLLVRISTG